MNSNYIVYIQYSSIIAKNHPCIASSTFNSSGFEIFCILTGSSARFSFCVCVCVCGAGGGGGEGRGCRGKGVFDYRSSGVTKQEGPPQGFED